MRNVVYEMYLVYGMACYKIGLIIIARRLVHVYSKYKFSISKIVFRTKSLSHNYKSLLSQLSRIITFLYKLTYVAF